MDRGTFDLGVSLYFGDLALGRAIGPSPWFSFLALTFVRSSEDLQSPALFELYTSFSEHHGRTAST